MTRCRDKHTLTNCVSQYHPQMEEDSQAAAHVSTEQDEAVVPPLTTVEHHQHQLPEHLLADRHDEGPQDEADDPPLTTEGGTMTRSRTRARNRHML